MKQVALCFSGLVKNFWQTIPNLIDSIIKPNPNYKFDIFIDTWDVIDVRFINEYEHINFNSKDKELLYNLFKPYANNITIRSEPMKFFDIEKYKPFISFGDIHPGSDGNHVMAMYYKIFQCNEIKKKQEKDNGFIYDVVIRTRLDLQICDAVILDGLDLSNIWVLGDANINPLPDCFSISSSENINMVSDLWLNMESVIVSNNTFNPHRILAGYLKNKQIKSLFIPNYSLRPGGGVMRFYWVKDYVPKYKLANIIMN